MKVGSYLEGNEADKNAAATAEMLCADEKASMALLLSLLQWQFQARHSFNVGNSRRLL